MSSAVLMITSKSLGSDVELGKILLKAYLGNVVNDNYYSCIILMNEGVALVCDKNLVADFNELGKTSKILICQTCLDYYNLNDKVLVGQKSNMIEINSYLKIANKICNI